MFNRLLPRETSFFDFFEQHAALVVRGARELLSMAGGSITTQDAAKRIKSIEHEADDVTHRCVAALHKTFITPIERNDVHRLIVGLDDVIDLIDGAARRLSNYELDGASDPVKKGAETLVQSTESMERAVKGLRDMKHAKAILEECVKMNQFENQGDTIHAAAMARLFSQERDSIVLIKWRDVYDSIENALDACEDVANIIEGIVLEHG
jgi:predicted phosphate transport protein (TIGR00153 family)